MEGLFLLPILPAKSKMKTQRVFQTALIMAGFVMTTFAEEPGALISKFEWDVKTDVTQKILQKDLREQPEFRRNIDHWRRRYSDPMFLATVDKIERFVAKCDFVWAALVESCNKGDIGVSESVSFVAKMDDGRLLILQRVFKGDFTGVVWGKGKWESIKELAAFEKEIIQIPEVESGTTEEGQKRDGGWDVVVVHAFLKGKSYVRVLGYFSAETPDLHSTEKRIVFVRTYIGAMYFGRPFVWVERELGLDGP